MKYYAVKTGYKTGVFESWDECQTATKGFPNAVFNSFATKEEAEAFLQGKDLWEDIIKEDNAKGFLVSFVDGSYNKDLNRYSYGVVLVLPDGIEKHICGYGNNPEYIDSNNIIGEIFGVINALDWAISNGFERIKIYHDYEGLSKWLTGEWKAKSNVSKMFVSMYKGKFEDAIFVEFQKVPSHCNISYNDKADQLAKTALTDYKRIEIKGDHWYSIPYFSENDFQAFSEIITENDSNISFTTTDYDNKTIYRFTLDNDTVTVTLFKSGNHSLLVQGKNSYLFQVIATTIVELDDQAKVEQIMGSAYRLSIKSDVIDLVYKPIESGLPSNYPNSIKRLIKQSTINLKYYIESEEYSQYAFPALKALEGHIKYLIKVAGGQVGQQFNQFNKTSGGTYCFVSSLTDPSKKTSIENCYNYYKSQRDTSFHFGEIIGSTDSTRLITSKEEADEIIKKCLDLINTQR